MVVVKVFFGIEVLIVFKLSNGSIFLYFVCEVILEFVVVVEFLLLVLGVELNNCNV